MVLLVILSPINASEINTNTTTDNSNFQLEMSTEDINDEIYTSDYYDGNYEYNDSYYDYNNDPSIDYHVSGIYHGPHKEPALVIKEFNISAGDIDSNNYVTINVKFNGTICSNIFTLERYPVRIQENNKIIGIIEESSVSNTDYPISSDDSSWATFKPNYAFTTSFKYKLTDNTTELRLILCSFSSNTLVFHGLTKKSLTNLNENSIKIINNNKQYSSNSSWLNDEKSLNKALELVEENGTIYLNNIDFYINSKININKNISIIGNNVIIDALENPEIFEITSNAKLTNITFKNTSDYILNIKNVNCTLENCIFTQTNGKIINNRGNLKIINSKFNDIDGIKTFNKMKMNNNTYTLIYNQNTIELKNTTFTNIKLPRYIELDNEIVNSSYLFYNLKNSTLKVENSTFNNVSTKIIYNDGSINLKNTNITNTNIELPILKTTSLNKKLRNNELISSYIKTWDPNTLTGLIDNIGKLNISNCNIENITWVGKKGIGTPLSSLNNIIFYTYDPYEAYGVHGVLATSFLTEAGAINNKGTLFIEESSFKGLSTTSAGAIYNSGNATLNKINTNNIKINEIGGAIVNKGEMSINSSYFNNTSLSVSYTHNIYGGVIYNSGKLNIENTIINKSSASRAKGGSIYNKGELNISKSSISNSYSDEGGAISNEGTLNINSTLFEKCSSSYGIINNKIDGNAIIYNSSFIDSSIGLGGSYPRSYFGIIANEGNMLFERNILDFKNYVADSGSGTYGIHNNGKIKITHNLFINTNTTTKTDRWGVETRNIIIFIINEGGETDINYNYFDTNKDPYNNFSTANVGHYFVFDIEEEYLPLQIGEKANITTTLKLDNGKYYEHYELLPNITVEYTITRNNEKQTIYAPMINGKATIEFNKTNTKGSYNITARLGYCIQEITADIGKNYSQMDVKAEEITYPENATFHMTVTGNLTHQPTGKITLIIDGKKYTTNINDTKAEITIPGLIPKTYDIIIRYEGDEDYFKSFYHHNYTVHKQPTKMNITINEINYGEIGILKVTLSPEKVSTRAYLYITDENNQTTRKTAYVINGTEIKLKNYAAGQYNLTLETWENRYYESSNATAIFKVNKYPTNLTINATNINAGENEILTIILNPKGEVAGEATLTINNHTEIIYLKNGENTVTITNVTGGTYTVTVTFPGDKKYGPSNATTTFTAQKIQTKTTAKIENNTLHINVEPNTTGTVILYINDDKYEINLTDSKIKLPINFTKAENNIFIYYPGNRYYNYSTYNLTYEYEELLNLTGYDETFYNTENATYYVTLTDEEGYGIANRTIIITINKKTTKHITEHDGSITIKLDPTVGEYDITAQYKNKTTKNKITILEDAFIYGNDTQAYTNVDFKYQIELKDHNGKAIPNAEISFNINGKTYKTKTDNKGLATLNLKLKEGNYNITTQYKTAKNVNNIYVGDILLKGNDLTIYNTETGIYKLSLIDKNGKGVANQTITITLNNKKYTRTTDKNGQTTLSIKLNTGKYPITAQFNDQKITNTITVLEDAFLSVNNTKAYENVDFTHIAKLTDHNGKGIADAEITFKINDKTYTNKTNKEGLAILTLNLKEGNYTITSTYKNITKTSKIIIIDDSHLVGNDVKAYSGTDFKYKVKLTDHNNNPIANAEITFKLEDKTFSRKTNSNGQIELTFNLETGTYTITANYKKLTIKNNFEIIEDYILSGNDVKAYSETDFPYNVKLTDHNGKAIKNAEIIFTVNGKTYTNKTDVNGKAIINLNLKTGTYTITARYRNTTTTNTLTIIEDYILSGNDIKAYEDDNFQYKVNLTDHNGKAIKNAEITFKVGEKTYSSKTNSQGQATITLNLNEGNYTIIATYKNTTTTNELEIIENHILTGQNVKAYENTDFTYTITLKRTDGVPLTNKEITFIINNRRYTDMTNSEGKASKTLNLPEGNYTITAIYKNTRITNNLTIIEDYNLNANNIRAYANENFQYKVNLTDHNKNPIKNAEITFEINGQTYKNKTDKQGQAILNLNLKEGNYTITASYRNTKITNNLEIIETYTLKGINAKSYEDFDFEYIVTLKNHKEKTIENAEITFEINGQTYKNKTDKQGQAILNLNLKEGNYTITAKYKNTITTNKLNIIKYDLEKIESSDLIMYYKDGSKFTIRLTENNTALTNKTVQFIINGNTYKRTTNDEGYASIAINLNSGIHNITTRYNNISTTNTITIKSTIEGNDLTKIYKNDTQYYATFYNSKGEPLKNTKVIFNINGVMYERNTNENGQAKMNINLAAGTYIITATNPVNGEQHSNTITVFSKIQENKDLTKYYKNASQYIVKVIDSKGNPAKAGQKVTFNINGVFYERYTNETGHVKMNINLPPGEYIITAEYEGCKVSNKITVLPILKATDVTMKYRDGTQFKATLVDEQGKPYANQQVTFNINGVFYTRTTNENGIAKLNINLIPGKYIITSSYNGLNIANTIKIES
ncbi:Ig-like domain-containing protein [uncultured Methanobrevibacter sp.]|uniref:Ig-like domain-containing protein n=1 Tax=uncultured Methanobrevibacter sp. TaxID=253161 RepID=UPI0025FFD286|nr:Ig-like domain repeat protein [uncultured Methanobrevibacter sp.]